jgi:Aminoacyl-tRNA editing domain
MLRAALLQVTGFESYYLFRHTVRIESQSFWLTSARFRYPSSIFTCSITMDHNSRLSKISIAPHSIVSHAATDSPAAWRSSLSTNPSAPQSYELTKTLVFKPKTAKNATPVPVVVVLREETDMSSAALAKKLKLKELRLASEDLLKEFFALDKDSCMSFLLFVLRMLLNLPVK